MLPIPSRAIAFAGRLAGAATIALLLGGCGGGGGGGDPTPRDDRPLGGTIIDALDLTGPTPGPGPSGTTDTGGGIPVTDDRLAALYGTLDLEWTFEFTGDTFAQTVRLDERGRTINDGREFVVTTDAGAWDAFLCSVLPEPDGRYVCVGIFTSTAVNVFLFSLDESGTTGVGVFEFCTEGTDPDECGRNAVLDPRGPMTVLIDRTAVPGTSAALASRNRDILVVDHEIYMIGLDQADPRTEGTGDSVVADAVGELTEHACRLAESCGRGL